MDTPKLLPPPAPVSKTIIVKIEETYHFGFIDPADDNVYTENVYGVYPVNKIQGWYPLPV